MTSKSHDFVVGERVRAIANQDSKSPGQLGEGTIVWVFGGSVSVEWDNNIGGHNCNGRAKYGHGWDMSYKRIERVQYDYIPTQEGDRDDDL